VLLLLTLRAMHAKTFKVVFLLTLIYFLTIFLPPAFAKETYFEFIPASSVLSLENEVEILFKYELINLKENSFRVRPASNVKYTQIWNDESEKWVSESALWSDFPVLSKAMKLKFLSGEFSYAEVYFQVQNTKTALIYETPRHKIWSRGWFSDYVRRLNENIMKLEK